MRLTHAPGAHFAAMERCMFIEWRHSKLCVVTDTRLRSDKEYGTAAVLRNAPELAKIPCDRIALFEAGTTPSSADKQTARTKLIEYFERAAYNVVVVLPTADVDDVGETQQAATICWQVFNAPDSLSNMRGCFYDWQLADRSVDVLPIFPRSPWLKQLQRWQQQVWLHRAYRIACAGDVVLYPPKLIIEPSPYMVEQLKALRGPMLAVDIESIEGTELVTAIGLSDGTRSVSIPYHVFRPHGAEVDTPSLLDYSEGSEIFKLTSAWLFDADIVKVFHNHTFDVPRLERVDLHVRGPVHDTFAASGVAYPELRHGLQHAVAREVACPPWKSIWHPRLKGVTRDDIEFWTCDPVELRKYNARDAFYTWHLAQRLLPKVGVFDAA